MQNKASFSVVIVDDKIDILEIMQFQISELNLNVLSFQNPNDALVKIKEQPHEIALIVSDFNMPSMNGFEFRKEILKFDKDIPFILCSAHVSKEDALNALEYKITSFLSKPFEKSTFQNSIKKYSADRINQLNEEHDLKAGFIEEAENLLEDLEENLLELQSNSSSEVLQKIFGIIHTIKGSSGFFKNSVINKFTHKFEDYYSPYSKGNKAINKLAIGVFLKAYDHLKNLIYSFKENSIHHYNLENLLLIFNEDFALKEFGDNNTTPKNNNLNFSKDIKISMEMLNNFSELSGEVTVIRNMINKTVRKVEKEFAGNKDVANLSELLNEMYKINSSLQDKIEQMKRYPLKDIYRPLKRSVRELSQSLNKKVEFNAKNEELRIESSLYDVLSNSLIHLIRNSIDHGIETESQRKINGKNPIGEITITAKETSDEVIVSIMDDGKGLDTDIIKNKILEKKLKTNSEINKMSEKEIWSMIFASGFSTAQQITDVSGRGVGMDMVKKSVEKVGGKIDIHSILNRGITFTITLPIPKTVMIVGSVIVQCGSVQYAILQDNISRLLNYEKDDSNIQFKHLQGADCLLIENKLFPIIDLKNALSEIKTNQDMAKMCSKRTGQFVLVKADGIEYAIYVDSILDQEDTVIKKLGPHLKSVKHFIGATYSGDGGVSLILDVVGLANMYDIKEDVKKLHATQNIKNETNQKILNGLNEERYLLFKMKDESLYGVKLSEVYRLEKFESNKVQLSGEQMVVLYRDGLLPLYDLRSYLPTTATESVEMTPSSRTNIIDVIVVERKNQFEGYIISSIEDLVQTNAILDESLACGTHLIGAMIIENRTVSIVSLKDFDQQTGTNCTNNSDELSSEETIINQSKVA